MTKYTAHGKQIRRGLEHVADAADETWAQIIADALNGERGHTGGPITLGDAPAYTMGYAGPEHIVQPGDKFTMADYARGPDRTIRNRTDGHTWHRQQDGYRCSCGVRWDADEGSDHP